MYRHVSVVLLFLMLGLIGCSKPSDQAADQSASEPSNSLFGSKESTLPAGTAMTVRLEQTVGSKISRSGDNFEATVANPVESKGQIVIPAKSPVTGHVVSAVPQGRFAGGAALKLVLDTVTVNGSKYDLQTESVSRSLKGKGKRTATLIGGGAGGGALIGGLAGGGKGALIGAALGAGAGTAGAAYTGNKEIVLPAESALSFNLLQPVEIKQ